MIIEADLHTHTLASTHAYSTIKENCQCAAEYGLKAIAMTDHMINMPDSPHIWHFENLFTLPDKICGSAQSQHLFFVHFVYTMQFFETICVHFQIML